MMQSILKLDSCKLTLLSFFQIDKKRKKKILLLV